MSPLVRGLGDVPPNLKFFPLSLSKGEGDKGGEGLNEFKTWLIVASPPLGVNLTTICTGQYNAARRRSKGLMDVIIRTV